MPALTKKRRVETMMPAKPIGRANSLRTMSAFEAQLGRPWSHRCVNLCRTPNVVGTFFVKQNVRVKYRRENCTFELAVWSEPKV